MTTRVAGLVALCLALFSGLAWFWMTSGDPGTRLAGLEPAAPEAGPASVRRDTSLSAPPEAAQGAEGRTGVSARKPRRPQVTGGYVDVTVREASGGPIQDALGRWELSQYRMACVGTRDPVELLTYGELSAAKSPHRFASIYPTLVDGDQVFRVLVTQRPSTLSLTLAGVVIATRKVELGETEIEILLTEREARSAFGGVGFCITGAKGGALRARSYLRSADSGKDRMGSRGLELTAEPNNEGCVEFRGAPPGEYSLSVFANRYASHFQTVRIEPSQVTSLSDVELQSPIPVVGQLVGDKRFRANRKLAIQVLDRSGPELKAVDLREVSTDGKGTFRIFDLPAGEYAIRVVLPQNLSKSNSSVWPLSWPVVVDTRNGPQMNVELELQDAHGVVVRNTLTTDIELDVRDRTGVSVMRFELGGKGVQHVPLLAGYYQLVATRHGREVARSNLQTPPAMTAIIGG